MKSLHRPDLFSWSTFDESRNLDFHGFAWIRLEGNVLIDPVPMSPHDQRHVAALGGASYVVVTNSDHVRAAVELADFFRAELVGPRAEKDTLGLPDARWVADGDEIVPSLRAIELHGSKTPGELALLLGESTLICGDLVRGHVGGRLNLLPDAKLTSKADALESVRRLAALEGIEAVLVGDGWPVFHHGRERLRELLEST
jgi:hypothetical protein